MRRGEKVRPRRFCTPKDKRYNDHETLDQRQIRSYRHAGSGLNSGKGPVTLADISVNQGISLSYLEQLFAALRGKQLVRGVRGPGGGYYLGKASDEISIADIICAVDEWVEFTRCGGRENCRDGEAVSDPYPVGSAQRRDFQLPE